MTFITVTGCILTMGISKYFVFLLDHQLSFVRSGSVAELHGPYLVFPSRVLHVLVTILTFSGIAPGIISLIEKYVYVNYSRIRTLDVTLSKTSSVLDCRASLWGGS